jgi:hypothetical protein
MMARKKPKKKMKSVRAARTARATFSKAELTNPKNSEPFEIYSRCGENFGEPRLQNPNFCSRIQKAAGFI